MTDVQIPATCSSSPYKDDRHVWRVVAGHVHSYMMSRNHFETRYCTQCKLLIVTYGKRGDDWNDHSPQKEERIIFATDGKEFSL